MFQCHIIATEMEVADVYSLMFIMIYLFCKMNGKHNVS